MNILFLSHQAEFIYGGEICTLEIIKALRNAGVNVFFALPDGPYKKRAEEFCTCLPLSSIEFQRKMHFLPHLLPALWKSSKEISVYIEKYKIDCVHATSLKSFVYAWKIARQKKLPAIWHHHDIMPQNIFNKIWLCILAMPAAKIIVPSLATRHALFQSGVSYKKIEVINNAFPKEQWIKRSLHSKENKKRFCISMIGEISHRKGSDWIGPLMEQLEEKMPGQFILQVIGEGLSDPIFAETIKKENQLFIEKGVIQFLGRRNDVKDLLQKTDILWVPSRQDPLPTVIVEAGFSGVPVLASPTGGIPEMVENNRNGFLCESIKEFTQKFILLKQDPLLWEKLSIGARKFAEEKYSIEKMTEKLLHLYRETQRKSK